VRLRRVYGFAFKITHKEFEMAWKVRVEWALQESDGVAVVLGSETLTGSGGTVTPSSIAPAFRSLDRGQALVTVLQGAVIVGIGDSSPTETDSLRLEESADPRKLSIRTGQQLFFIEAGDPERLQEVTAPPPVAMTVTIAAGESLSAAVQVDGKFGALILPAGWTAAPLTFVGSFDGVTYAAIYDGAVERTIAQADAVAGRLIALDPADWLAIKHIKIRSGTAAAPVVQVAERVVSLARLA